MIEAKQKNIARQQQYEVDNVMYDYLQHQILCLFIQHAANVEIKKDMKKGVVMLHEVEEMRSALNDIKKNLESMLSKEEIEASRERIGFYQELYHRVSDSVFESNRKYSNFLPRPEGIDYVCKPLSCQQDIDLAVVENFPQFFENAA